MRTVNEWLDEYGTSHRHATNKALHWICVPVIVVSLMGLLWLLPVPAALRSISPLLNWGTLLLAAIVLCVALFAVAWIGQFIGHHYEGKRPSFFKDVQFLLIGPLWLMSFVYRKLRIPY